MLPGAYRRILPAALTLSFLGISGLAFLITTAYPVLWARWVFFLCLSMASTGLSMPLFAYLHHRFPGNRLTHERTVLREGLWLGGYLGILAWLQMGRILTPFWALSLALGFALLETLWLLSERNRKPH